jgi:hypothetical protein
MEALAGLMLPGTAAGLTVSSHRPAALRLAGVLGESKSSRLPEDFFSPASPANAISSSSTGIRTPVYISGHRQGRKSRKWEEADHSPSQTPVFAKWHHSPSNIEKRALLLTTLAFQLQ